MAGYGGSGNGGGTVWRWRCGKNDGDGRSRFGAILEVKWCSFLGKIVLFWILFGCYLGVERSDYGTVATDDNILMTCGLAVKGIMWLRKWFHVVELCFTCLLGIYLGS